MSQQSEMAETVYKRLSGGPVAAAALVREIHKRWGAEHSFLAVHGFVREVATDLLHYDDVEVGDLKEGRFVSWGLEQCDANSKIDEEIMSMGAFLEDDTRYVFHRKTGA